jgi:hypothetical protein
VSIPCYARRDIYCKALSTLRGTTGLARRTLNLARVTLSLARPHKSLAQPCRTYPPLYSSMNLARFWEPCDALFSYVKFSDRGHDRREVGWGRKLWKGETPFVRFTLFFFLAPKDRRARKGVDWASFCGLVPDILTLNQQPNTTPSGTDAAQAQHSKFKTYATSKPTATRCILRSSRILNSGVRIYRGYMTLGILGQDVSSDKDIILRPNE